MFGYVVVNQQELKFKEYDLYRSYYCGFCRTLRAKHGFVGQFTLSYDMTFLILLLSDLYDEKDVLAKTHCIAHPFSAHPTRTNKVTEYAADMNMILSYYSCLDDWTDEKKLKSLILTKLLKKGEGKAAVDYGKKAALVKDRLDRLHAAENENSSDIDLVSGYFGDIMAELFAIYEDEWESPLRKLGFFLGKFIYIMDAYDDLDKDAKSGSYNPLLSKRDEDGFDEWIRQILTMMMAKTCEAFEVLPCVQNIDILRNILYSGVWSRYNAIQSAKEEAKNTSDSEQATQ